MSEFDDIDTQVAAFNPLSAEDARRLYARMVSKSARISALEQALRAAREALETAQPWVHIEPDAAAMRAALAEIDRVLKKEQT